MGGVGGLTLYCCYLYYQLGYTPLFFASMEGHDELVDLLLAHSAEVNKVQYCNVSMACSAAGHFKLACG